MDKFEKSGENVIKFIIDSLKGKGTNENLQSMPEMRNLNPGKPFLDSISNVSDSPISNFSVSPISNVSDSPNFLQIFKNDTFKNLMKILAFLLILFVIYKLLETYPDISTKIQTIFGNVEKEIKSIKIANPIFDASNSLNSNEILDFLLGAKKTNEEWCFIGESKGKRYCTLSNGNQCMSGNIFPNKDICVNPKLKS